MIRTLVAKEIRQHWPAFFLITLALLASYFMLASWRLEAGSGTGPFEILRIFLGSFAVLAAAVICNRLVVVEYQAKTQLFLEALPLTRGVMVMVKWLLGAAMLLGPICLLLLFSAATASNSEELTTKHLLIVATSTLSVILCFYSLFFLMGLLGRYRIAIYLSALLAVTCITEFTDLDVTEFGPINIFADRRFGYQRTGFPLHELSVTWFLTAAFIVLTLVLSLVKEGSVATLLAEKMSYREKIFVACALLTFLAAITTYDSKVVKEPYDLIDAEIGHSGPAVVKVSAGTGDGDASARQLAVRMADHAAEVAEFLELTALPPIFVVLRRDLDADKYEIGHLESDDSLLIRANFESASWNENDFFVWFTGQIVAQSAVGTASSEQRRWVLDGFPLYWAATRSRPLVDWKQSELRAAFGGRQGFRLSDTKKWFVFRDRIGDDIASAVAMVGLQHLAHKHGTEQCRVFVMNVLPANRHEDVRATLNLLRRPVGRVFTQTFGESYGDFAQEWCARVAALATARAQELDGVPKLSDRLDFEPISSQTYKLKYEFSSEPAPRDGRFEFRHAKLGVFDMAVSEQDLHRENLMYATDSRGESPDTFSRGTRVRWTFATHAERLGCDIISGWRVREVE